VSDFGLGDRALDSKKLTASLRWHLGAAVDVRPDAAPEPRKDFDIESFRCDSGFDLEPLGWRLATGSQRAPARSDWVFPGNISSYKAYLASKLWKRIRQRILRRDNSTCQACLEPAKCVHHIDYSEQTLAGKSDLSLISLCNTCHYKIEHQGGAKIPCSQEDLKRQLLSDLMAVSRGTTLEEWRQGHGTPKRKSKSQKRAAKRRRKAIAQSLRDDPRLAAIFEAISAAQSETPPWLREIYLKYG